MSVLVLVHTSLCTDNIVIQPPAHTRYQGVCVYMRYSMTSPIVCAQRASLHHTVDPTKVFPLLGMARAADCHHHTDAGLMCAILHVTDGVHQGLLWQQMSSAVSMRACSFHAFAAIDFCCAMSASDRQQTLEFDAPQHLA